MVKKTSLTKQVAVLNNCRFFLRLSDENNITKLYVICEKIIRTDCVSRPLPSLILFQFFLFRLHFRKFVNSLLNYLQKK